MTGPLIWSCFVDSDSVTSVLPRTATKQALQPTNFKLYAEHSFVINTYRQQVLTINLGLRRAINWSFTIADVKSPIIAADFIAHFGLLIDLKWYRLVDPLTALSTSGSFVATVEYNISTVDQQSLVNFHPQIPISPCLSLHQQPTVTTSPPVVERVRRFAGEKLKVAKDDIDFLLQHNAIRPSSFQWARPIHMVPKRLGSWPISSDHRRLIAQAIPDRYPIPFIEDLFQGLHDKKVFSTIDLVRAYH